MVNLCVKLTGLKDAQRTDETLFQGVSVRVLLEEISIWISKLCKDHPHEYRWASSNLLRAWIEQKGGERANSLFLLKVRHLFFSAQDISVPSCWAFGLRPGHTPPTPYQAFGFELNYATGFPGSLACRQWIMGLLGLHNWVSQFL